MIAETIRGTFAALTIDPIHPRDPALIKMFGLGRGTAAGVAVDEEKAVGYPPFWRGVNIICNGVAKPGVAVYRRLSNDEREKDRRHPAHPLLTRKPNRYLQSGEFRRLLQFWALTWGNGCAWIRRNNAGQPIDIWPLLPDRTTAHVVDDQNQEVQDSYGDGSRLVYVSRVAGKPVTFPAEDVIHIHGLGFDGYSGYPVVELMKESLGLGIAAQEYGSRFFGNGATASGIVMAPPGMKPEQMGEYSRAIKEGSEGLGKAHKLLVLGNGTEFKQLTIPPEHAQFLQTREFQTRDVANIIGVQSHKLGDPTRTSYNSLEQSNQEHLDDDLDPWLQTWEDECGDKLLAESEKESDSHYVEFNRSSLIRMDAAAKAASYSSGRQWSYLSANDIRKMENMPPIEGGDVYLAPANMVPTTMLGTMTAPPITDDPPEPSDTEAALIAHEIGRLRRQVAKAASVAAGKGPKEYGAFLERIAGWAEQPECIADRLQAVADDLSATFGAFAEPPYTSANFADAVTKESERLLAE